MVLKTGFIGISTLFKAVQDYSEQYKYIMHLQNYYKQQLIMVNLHYQTQLCKKSPFVHSMLQGFVTDVSYYKMSEVSEKMSYESVLMTAGPQIAEFCRDYTVKFEKTTAIAEGGEFAASSTFCIERHG